MLQFRDGGRVGEDWDDGGSETPTPTPTEKPIVTEKPPESIEPEKNEALAEKTNELFSLSDYNQESKGNENFVYYVNDNHNFAIVISNKENSGVNENSLKNREEFKGKDILIIKNTEPGQGISGEETDYIFDKVLPGSPYNLDTHKFVRDNYEVYFDDNGKLMAVKYRIDGDNHNYYKYYNGYSESSINNLG